MARRKRGEQKGPRPKRARRLIKLKMNLLSFSKKSSTRLLSTFIGRPALTKRIFAKNKDLESIMFYSGNLAFVSREEVKVMGGKWKNRPIPQSLKRFRIFTREEIESLRENMRNVGRGGMTVKKVEAKYTEMCKEKERVLDIAHADPNLTAYLFKEARQAIEADPRIRKIVIEAIESTIRSEEKSHFFGFRLKTGKLAHIDATRDGRGGWTFRKRIS